MIKLNYWLSYGSMRNCHIINHTNWDTNFLFYFVNLLLKEAHRWPQKTSSKISQKKKKSKEKSLDLENMLMLEHWGLNPKTYAWGVLKVHKKGHTK